MSARFRLYLFVLHGILLAIMPSLAWPGLPEVVAKMKPSVVGIGTVAPSSERGEKRVLPWQFRGTGFVVGDGSQVVTSYHVVVSALESDGKEVLVVVSGHATDSVIHHAQVAATDQEHDLVLLQIDGARLPAVEVAGDKPVLEGQAIAFTGFPIGSVLGLYPVTHQGIVSAITPIALPTRNSQSLTPAAIHRTRNPFKILQLDATAYPGNSGSPVYDPQTGQLVGVLNSVFIKQTRETMLEKPSGISYAIPARYVVNLLGLARSE